MSGPDRWARWVVEHDGPERIVLRDVGPWDRHPTVTNDAENVVAEMAAVLDGRRLFYRDSEGAVDEILVRDGKFAGFAPGGEPDGGRGNG